MYWVAMYDKNGCIASKADNKRMILTIECDTLEQAHEVYEQAQNMPQMFLPQLLEMKPRPCRHRNHAVWKHYNELDKSWRKPQ